MSAKVGKPSERNIRTYLVWQNVYDFYFLNKSLKTENKVKTK